MPALSAAVEQTPAESDIRSAAPRGPGHVAVIGGGISGLACAHYLLEAGARVSLFESSDQFGGLGTWFEYEGDSLDRYYHVILPTDDDLLSLVDFLGLGDRVYWRETSLGFLYENELYRLDSALDLLRFQPAAFTDRIRLGLTALYASYVARPGPLDDVTVEDWLTRLSGRRAFDGLWRPLLEAKFGDAYRQIPALWYWASFNREKGTKKERKGYLRGGYRGLTAALVESLRARGARLYTGSPVDALELPEGIGPTLLVNGETREFDRVISTLPMTQLRGIARSGSAASCLERLNGELDYQGVLNVLVMLRRSVTSHYWIPVVRSGTPFQGIVETTHAIDLEDTGGRHLAYLLNYVHRSDPLFERDPDSVIREYVEALIRLVPSLEREDVIDARLFKAPFVEPLYAPGYSRRKPPAELVPGKVFLATTAQVYPDVTSWNSSTRVARNTVETLVEAAT